MTTTDEENSLGIKCPLCYEFTTNCECTELDFSVYEARLDMENA